MDTREHPVPDRGVELGHKSTIALFQIAAAGGVEVSITDLPPRERRFLARKGWVLARLALVTVTHGAIVNGRVAPDRYTLTDLGRMQLDLIRAAESAIDPRNES